MNGQRPNALAKSLERRLVRAWEAHPGPKFGTPTLRALPPGPRVERTFTTTPHVPVGEWRTLHIPYDDDPGAA